MCVDVRDAEEKLSWLSRCLSKTRRGEGKTQRSRSLLNNTNPEEGSGRIIQSQLAFLCRANPFTSFTLNTHDGRRGR